MTPDEFQYVHDQYYLSIVNDGDWYKNLRGLLDAGEFQKFCVRVEDFAEKLRRQYKLRDYDTNDKVYIRLMVLEYMLSSEMVRARFGNDDIFCKHISYAHSHGFGWLASRVMGTNPATPEAINGQPETQPIQENPMPSIEIKNITYINNADVRALSDEQLIDSIKQLETEIADLGLVKTESVKIKAKIAALQDTLTKVVAILDAR
jgi:hypothetical protein